MKKLVFMIISALICGAVFTSCGTDKTQVIEDCEDCSCIFNFSHEKNASIIGEWKLEKIKVHSRLGISCTDCSPYNVVYEFKKNGTLTVSGNTENYGWHESGKYSFIKDEWGAGRDDYPWGLNINEGLTNWFMLSSKTLIIDYSPLDGGTFYLVKK